MRKHSEKFLGTITPLNAHMLAVAATVVSDEPLTTQVEDEPSQADQPTPSRSPSPNDLTPTDEDQTSGGDEGNVNLSSLNHEVFKLKKENST